MLPPGGSQRLALLQTTAQYSSSHRKCSRVNVTRLLARRYGRCRRQTLSRNLADAGENVAETAHRTIDTSFLVGVTVKTESITGQRLFLYVNQLNKRCLFLSFSVRFRVLSFCPYDTNWAVHPTWVASILSAATGPWRKETWSQSSWSERAWWQESVFKQPTVSHLALD